MESATEKKLMYDGEAVTKCIHEIAFAIHREFPENSDPVPAIIGIQSGGIPFSKRLAKYLLEEFGMNCPAGILDTAMYRDDFGTRKTLPVIRETEILFDINKRPIILADDVLQTGRSIRAALDALNDYGRPSLIRLAVLVDRGLREYPIRADYTGMEVTVDPTGKIRVGWSEYNQDDGIYMIPGTPE